jgi:hypothetical protein
MQSKQHTVKCRVPGHAVQPSRAMPKHSRPRTFTSSVQWQRDAHWLLGRWLPDRDQGAGETGKRLKEPTPHLWAAVVEGREEMVVVTSDLAGWATKDGSISHHHDSNRLQLALHLINTQPGAPPSQNPSSASGVFTCLLLVPETTGLCPCFPQSTSSRPKPSPLFHKRNPDPSYVTRRRSLISFRANLLQVTTRVIAS